MGGRVRLSPSLSPGGKRTRGPRDVRKWPCKLDSMLGFLMEQRVGERRGAKTKRPLTDESVPGERRAQCYRAEQGASRRAAAAAAARRRSRMTTTWRHEQWRRRASEGPGVGAEADPRGSWSGIGPQRYPPTGLERPTTPIPNQRPNKYMIRQAKGLRHLTARPSNYRCLAGIMKRGENSLRIEGFYK